MFKNAQNEHMYISLDTDKDCDLLAWEDAPWQQNRNYLDHN